jgi:hypothetical protein
MTEEFLRICCLVCGVIGSIPATMETVDKVVNLDEFTIVSVKITWRTVD